MSGERCCEKARGRNSPTKRSRSCSILEDVKKLLTETRLFSGVKNEGKGKRSVPSESKPPPMTKEDLRLFHGSVETGLQDDCIHAKIRPFLKGPVVTKRNC